MRGEEKWHSRLLRREVEGSTPFVSIKELNNLDPGSAGRLNFLIFNAFARWVLGEAYFEIGDYRASKDHFGYPFRGIKQPS